MKIWSSYQRTIKAMPFKVRLGMATTSLAGFLVLMILIQCTYFRSIFDATQDKQKYASIFAGTHATDFFLFFLSFWLWIPLLITAVVFIVFFWKHRPQSRLWLFLSTSFLIITISLWIPIMIAKFQTLSWHEQSAKYLKCFGTRSSKSP